MLALNSGNAARNGYKAAEAAHDGRYTEAIENALCAAENIAGVYNIGRGFAAARRMPSVVAAPNSVASGLGGEILPATRIRAIAKGEKIGDLTKGLAQATYESGGLEHAIISLKDGSRVIVRGGSGGIQFGDDLKRVIGHTHPSSTGPSATDFDMLRQLGQKHSYIYELFGGGLSRFGL